MAIHEVRRGSATAQLDRIALRERPSVFNFAVCIEVAPEVDGKESPYVCHCTLSGPLPSTLSRQVWARYRDVNGERIDDRGVSPHDRGSCRCTAAHEGEGVVQHVGQICHVSKVSRLNKSVDHVVVTDAWQKDPATYRRHTIRDKSDEWSQPARRQITGTCPDVAGNAWLDRFEAPMR